MRSTKRPVSTSTVQPRRLSFTAGGCLAIAAVLTLSACGPDRAEPVPTPDDSLAAAAPVFASDEEALATVTAAYSGYVEAADAIAASGEGLDRLRPLVTDEFFASTEIEYANLTELGVRTIGDTRFDSVEIQSRRMDEHGVTKVVVYLCLDVTAVRLIDAAGADVTPVDRNDRLPLEVEFSADDVLLLARSAVWSGEDFC